MMKAIPRHSRGKGGQSVLFRMLLKQGPAYKITFFTEKRKEIRGASKDFKVIFKVC